MRRILTIFTVLCLIALLSAGCSKKPDAGTAAGPAAKLKVVVTIYPMYEFTRQVGGDRVEITTLIPPGAEPHDWEPTTKDLLKLKTASLLLYNGAGFEPIEKLLTKEILGTATAVEVSKGIPLLTAAAEQDDHGQGHNHSNQKTKGDQEVDPHVWLDPEYAKMEVDNIAAALSQADPANAAYYSKNAASYKSELTKLHEEFAAGLAGVSRRDIVTTHAAFGYLAKRYNLNQIPIMGLAPDAEPTPDKLAAIIRLCRDKNITTIFFESLVSPKLAQTIARETGARLMVLQPVDGLSEEDAKKGHDYLSLMRQNLANLKAALQ